MDAAHLRESEDGKGKETKVHGEGAKTGEEGGESLGGDLKAQEEVAEAAARMDSEEVEAEETKT